MDVKRDTLVIDMPHCGPSRDGTCLKSMDVSEIQNLAMVCRSDWWHPTWRDGEIREPPLVTEIQPYILKNVQGFAKLRNLSIILDSLESMTLSGNLCEPRLVNIDHRILEMATEDEGSRYEERERILQRYLDRAIIVKDQFQSLKEQSGTGIDLSKVTFNVAFLGLLDGTSLRPPRMSWVPLIPTIPKYYGVCYYMEKLEEKTLGELIGDESSHRFYFKALQC